jgi:hypothetical protein
MSETEKHETREKDWRPKVYQIGQLIENELMNADLEPFENGRRGFSVPLAGGGEMEVFFNKGKHDARNKRYVRTEPSHGEVCEAVERVFAWISGREF